MTDASTSQPPWTRASAGRATSSLFYVQQSRLLGESFSALGKRGYAVRYISQAQQAARSLGGDSASVLIERGTCAVSLGLAFARMGRSSESLTHLEGGLPFFESAGLAEGKADALIHC